MSATLGVLVRTIGRDSLRGMLDSTREVLGEVPVLLLFDGVDGSAWEAPGVEVQNLPRVGTYGHTHALKALNERALATDFIGFIDDDDIWLPAAKAWGELARPGGIVAFPLVDRSGLSKKPLSADGVGYYAYSTRTRRLVGMRAIVPNEPPFSWPDIRHDGSFYQACAERFDVAVSDVPFQEMRKGRTKR